MLTIDGAEGEGGGQILRSALALSLITRTPFRIENIRAGRKKPGLLRQHLTAVRAASEISGSQVDGAELGSRTLEVRPGSARGGEYHFSVGTAGSACLVLQTVLPPLLLAPQPSAVVLEGGTHNPSAPPWDFIARVFFPLLERMGAKLRTQLDRHGFYPAGGGKFRVEIEPLSSLGPIELMARGAARTRSARALVAHLSPEIGERELRVLQDKLPGLEDVAVLPLETSAGPGNALYVELGYENVTEMFVGFGERSLRAETVAQKLADEVRRYLASDAPVGPHLADQLMLPLALASEGGFRAVRLTQHARTNLAIVERFLPVSVRTYAEEGGAVRVAVGPR
jgi:RNA 3'-terminal phosphate cyclase (ATP)